MWPSYKLIVSFPNKPQVFSILMQSNQKAPKSIDPHTSVTPPKSSGRNNKTFIRKWSPSSHHVKQNTIKLPLPKQIQPVFMLPDLKFQKHHTPWLRQAQQQQVLTIRGSIKCELVQIRSCSNMQSSYIDRIWSESRLISTHWWPPFVNDR